VKFLNLKNIKPLVYLNNIIGLIYVILLLVVLYVYIYNFIEYNSYEKTINTHILKLTNLKKLNNKLLNNKFKNDFYSNEKDELSDNLYTNINELFVTVKEIKKSNLTKHLFLEEKINLLFLDYKHLEKQYNLFFKYTLQLGNSEYGLYAKLLHSSDELFDKLSDFDNNYVLISHYYQMKNMLALFHHNKLFYELFKNQINQIELVLNSKTDTYKNLRAKDALSEYQKAFNLFVKKKMQVGFNNEFGLTKKINNNINVIENRINEISIVLNENKHKNNLMFILIFIFLSILFLIISFIFSRVFYTKQSFFINQSKALIKGFDIGVFKNEKTIKLPTELDELITIINKFSKKLQKTEKVLLALPDRKINFEITDADRIQFLDKSLLKIWKNFELNDNDLESEKEKRIISDWIKIGLEKFTSILRKDFSNVSSLSKEILNNIIEHLNIAVGAIYLTNDNDESLGLNMVANFAFGNESHIQKEIYKGEGIIGTAAIEKKTMNITNIPENYYKVSSGFGETMPKNLLVVPIKFEEDFFGIIELASFRIIKSYELEFVEELGKAFAASLGANKIHQNVRKEFENLKEKTNILENEKINLENNIANLNNDYEKLSIDNFEYKLSINNLNNSIIIFDLNLEGYVLSANNQFYEIFQISVENINSVNYLDLIYKSEKTNDIDIDKFWNEIKLGSYKKIVHKIKIGEQDFWLSDKFIPIKDAEKNIKKIKVVSTNISDYKILEEIIENANMNIQELKLNNENNQVFINKLKSEIKENKKEFETKEAELLEIIKKLKN